MKIVFLGATSFSKTILESLLANENFSIAAIFGIPEEFHISYSSGTVRNYNYSNLRQTADSLNIPFYLVDSEKGRRLIDYYEQIKSINPHVILAMGWYYMIPRSIRDLAEYGAWGIHASLLPDYAGGAPLVWAMIRGENETGVTLFRMEDGVDDGDVISQKAFSIEFEDTIREVYAKATRVSVEILIHALAHIEQVTFTPQDKSKICVYPQRKPEDGEINLKSSAIEIYNFIRAQSSPYPGAFIRTTDNKKIIIEKARIED